MTTKARKLPAPRASKPVPAVPAKKSVKRRAPSMTRAESVAAPDHGHPVVVVVPGKNEVKAQVGQPFSYQIEASRDPASYVADGLPPGLALHAERGEIVGTPTRNGKSVVRLRAQNSLGLGPTAQLTIIVG